uniref:Glutamine rich 2 n=1 Tax=Rattus norvegicus TaxID=10116 RepID=A0ABK0LSH8_RAT
MPPSLLANRVSLRELADLAIGTPEVGAVNFTALHTLIVAILKSLNLQEVLIDFHYPSTESGRSVELSHSAPHVSTSKEKRRSLPKLTQTPQELECQVKDLGSQVLDLTKQLKTMDDKMQGMATQIDHISIIPELQRELSRSGEEMAVMTQQMSMTKFSKIYESQEMMEKPEPTAETITQGVQAKLSGTLSLTKITDVLQDLTEDVKILKQAPELQDLLQRVHELEKLVKSRDEYLDQLSRRLTLAPGEEEITMVTWEELEQVISDGWRASKGSSESSTATIGKHKFTSSDFLPSGMFSRAADQTLESTGGPAHIGGVGPDMAFSRDQSRSTLTFRDMARESFQVSSETDSQMHARRDEQLPGQTQQDRYQRGGMPGMEPLGMDQAGSTHPVVPLTMGQLGVMPPEMHDQRAEPPYQVQSGVQPSGADREPETLSPAQLGTALPLSAPQQGMMLPGPDQQGMEQAAVYGSGQGPWATAQQGLTPVSIDLQGLPIQGTGQQGPIAHQVDGQGLVMPGQDQRAVPPSLPDQRRLASLGLTQKSTDQQDFRQSSLASRFVQPGSEQPGVEQRDVERPGLDRRSSMPVRTERRTSLQTAADRRLSVPIEAERLSLAQSRAGQEDSVQPEAGRRGLGQPGVDQRSAPDQRGLVQQPSTDWGGLVQPGTDQQLVPPGAGQPGLIQLGSFPASLAQLGAGQQGPIQLDAGQPVWVQPSIDQSGWVQPGVDQHSLVQQELGQPDAVQLGLVQPGAYAPGLMQAGAGQHGLVQTGMDQRDLVQPGTDWSSVQPGVDQPGMAQPRVVQTGMAQPGAVQPGMAQPRAVQPGMAQPGAVQPGMAQPRVVQPGMAQLHVVQSGIAQPGAVQPGMAQAGAVQPGMAQAGAVQPGMVQPGAVQPGMAQPGAVQPGLAQPGVIQPGMAQPGVVQPAVLQPGIDQHGLVQTGALPSGWGQPGAYSPGLVQPGIGQYGLVQPRADQYDFVQPGDSQLGLMQPGVGQAVWLQSRMSRDLVQPGTDESDLAQRGITQQGLVQPGVARQGVVQPGMPQQGVAQPGLAQPGALSMDRLGLAQPIVDQSGLVQPGMDQHGLVQPRMYPYDFVEPSVLQRNFMQSRAVQPGLMQPVMDQRGLVQPGLAQARMVQPIVDQSSFIHPALMQPGTSQRGLMQSMMTQYGPMQPGAVQHGLVQPGMDQQDSQQLGEEKRGLLQPGAGQPGLLQPRTTDSDMMQPGIVEPGAGPQGLGQPGAGPQGLGQPGAYMPSLAPPGGYLPGFIQPGMFPRGIFQPAMLPRGFRQPIPTQPDFLAPGIDFSLTLEPQPQLPLMYQAPELPQKEDKARQETRPEVVPQIPPQKAEAITVEVQSEQADLRYPDQARRVEADTQVTWDLRSKPASAVQLGPTVQTTKEQVTPDSRTQDSWSYLQTPSVSETRRERQESLEKLAPSFPMAVETFRLIGEIVALYVELKEQLKDLDEEQAGQTDWEKIQYLIARLVKKTVPQDLPEQLKNLRSLNKEVRQDKAKLEKIQRFLDTDITGGKDVKPSHLSLQLGILRVTVSDIEKELAELRESQDRGKAAMENSVSEASLYLQDQLDKLRTIIESMLSSSSALLSLSITPHKSLGTLVPGQIDPEATCPACSLDVSHQVSLLVQRYEQLQDMVTGLAASRPSKKAKLQGQDEELLGHVQSAILQVQGDCEKLNITTSNLIEDHRQKQKDIEVLYQGIERLEKEKANRDHLEMEIDVKADKSALASKVSRIQFDATTEQLNHMMQELVAKMSGQEQDWQKLLDKLLAEMDSKLDRLELDPLKQTLEDRWKSLRQQLKERSPLYQADEAAAMRRQLLAHFHCLSCDRPLETTVTGQVLSMTPIIPSMPGHRSVRPYTVFELEQIRQQSRNLKLGSSFPRGDLSQMEKSVGRLRSMHSKMLMDIEKVQIHFGGSVKASSQMIRELLHSQCLSHPCYKRGADTTDYTYSTVPRRCGGSHTLTYPYRRNRPQHLSPLEEIQIAMKHDEVDILGLDGHIYKGRMDTRLPGILGKDAPGMAKHNKAKLQQLQQLQQMHQMQQLQQLQHARPHVHRQPNMGNLGMPPSRPQSAQMLADSNAVPSGQKKDRPVSSEGRLLQANIPTDMGSLPGSQPGMNLQMDMPPGEGMEEPTRGPRSTTAH